MERDGPQARPREEGERSAKAEAILQAARGEFLAQGYVAANMDRIAASAGVSKATVYSHYGDKDGLFTALSWHLVRQHGATTQPPGLWQGEPAVVLRRYATATLALLVDDPELLAYIRMAIGESSRFPALARALVQTTDEADITALTHYLAAHPELAVHDPEATARVIVGALFYFALSQEVLGGHEVTPMDRERIIAALLALVLPPTLPQ